MGWNDSRIVDAVFINKAIAFVFAAVFMLSISLPTNLNAQQEDQEKEDIMTYRINFWLPPLVRNHYSFTEQSDITRTYSDGSIMTYSREVTFFYDVKAPNPEKDGFLTLDISIDSMLYKYTKGDYTYSYNSQGILPGKFSLKDFTANIASLSRFFQMTYSPYGNVSKLEGDALNEYIQSLEIKKDAFDPVDYFLWLQGAATNRLIQIADMKKIQYPEYRLAEDSSFKSPFFIQLDHIDLLDTLNVTLTKVSAGMMYLSGYFNDPESLTKKAYFEDINDELVEIQNVTANGTIEQELTPRGTPEKTEIDMTMVVKAKIKREVFSEVVKSKMIWQLLGQWDY
jgi:hypothetical protein